MVFLGENPANTILIYRGLYGFSVFCPPLVKFTNGDLGSNIYTKEKEKKKGKKVLVFKPEFHNEMNVALTGMLKWVTHG